MYTCTMHYKLHTHTQTMHKLHTCTTLLPFCEKGTPNISGLKHRYHRSFEGDITRVIKGGLAPPPQPSIWPGLKWVAV